MRIASSEPSSKKTTRSLLPLPVINPSAARSSCTSVRDGPRGGGRGRPRSPQSRRDEVPRGLDAANEDGVFRGRRHLHGGQEEADERDSPLRALVALLCLAPPLIELEL